MPRIIAPTAAPCTNAATVEQQKTPIPQEARAVADAILEGDAAKNQPEQEQQHRNVEGRHE
jgi:hypothetical protein